MSTISLIPKYRLICFISLVCILSAIIAGCSQKISPPNPAYESGYTEPLQATATIAISPPATFSTITPTPTPPATQTLSPSATRTQTLEPTLDFSARNERLLGLLKTNGDCKLPCFWGIEPGMTAWEEAEKLFMYLNTGILNDNKNDQIRHYTGFDLSEGSLGIRLYFYEHNGNVEGILGGIGGRDYKSLAQGYFIYQTLSIYGAPSRIWVALGTGGEGGYADTVGYDLWLFYDGEGFALKYTGAALRLNDKYSFCPTPPQILDDSQKSQEYGAVNLYLQSLSNQRKLEDLVRSTGEIFPSTHSVEDAIGMTAEEFYKIIIESRGEKPTCFETTINIWP